jgi:hypothetical protein
MSKIEPFPQKKKAIFEKTIGYKALFLIFLASAPAAHGDNSRPQCFRQFLQLAHEGKSESHSEIKPGTLCRIQLRGDSTIQELTYSRSFSENGTDYVEFTKGYGKARTIHKFPRDKIRDFKKWENQGVVANKIATYTVGYPVIVHTLAKLMSYPYRNLASKPTINVVGSMISSQELGAAVAQKLETFDHAMLNLGFLRPESTRVIIDDQPILPSLTGPFSMNVPTFNLWDGKSKKVIAMNPIFWKTAAVSDNHVLHHERMHALLHRTYNAEAFVNKNSAIQEAFADFAAAHMEGSPHIGMDTSEKGLPLRNIESRSAENNKVMTSYNSLLEASGTDYHNNSLFMSNVLWKIRQSIGPEKMSNMLKKFTDDINQYHDSFEALEKKSGIPSSLDLRQRFIYDYEYFLAVMKRTGSEAGESRIAQIADSTISELGLSQNKINEIANSLERSQKSFVYDGKGELVNGIKVAAHGTAGLAVEGYFVYNLVSPDSNDKIDDKINDPYRLEPLDLRPR